MPAFVVADILTHELADDLRGRLVLRTADLNKPVSQIALDPNTESRIFCHYASVTNGYTARYPEG
ncbi:MAG: hypothetical protein Kow0032_07750 [Methyloligellaceae bacterium]